MHLSRVQSRASFSFLFTQEGTIKIRL
uniref:Uncharacterized protein n=1 Tax=Arundo donax TaxID=35708 RepID=A0A0A9A8M7_ARUDO